MKFKIFFIFGLIVVILLPISFAIQFNYFAPSDSAKISRIEQYLLIQNKDLYSETLIVGFITNKTTAYSADYPLQLWVRTLEGDKFLPLDIKNIIVCDGYPYNQSGDYIHIYTSCNRKINFNKTFERYGIQLLVNLSEIKEGHFYIRLNYVAREFARFNGNYEIGWLSNEINDDIPFSRTLMLPSENSVIESWNNFKILRTGKTGGWVLETTTKGDAMVWYRDYQKEKKERAQRDWLIIVISLALSIIIQIYFFLKRSKRTLNLWSFASIFLLITGFLLLFEKGIQHPYLLVFSFTLFIIMATLGYLSGLKDSQKSSYKKQIRDLIKFVKELFK